MLSDYQANKLISEHGAAQSRLARIKAEGKEVGEKAVFFGSAFAAGALVGYANAKEGGSAGSPYMVGGKVPLDVGLAVAAVGSGFLLRKHAKLRTPLLGAGAGAVGVVGARYGAQWQANNPIASLMGGSSASSTPAGASSSASSTPAGASSSAATPASGASAGWGGAQRPRLAPHGAYGQRQNPYARHFATAGR
jgi:hypothetical protein